MAYFQMYRGKSGGTVEKMFPITAQGVSWQRLCTLTNTSRSYTLTAEDVEKIDGIIFFLTNGSDEHSIRLYGHLLPEESGIANVVFISGNVLQYFDPYEASWFSLYSIGFSDSTSKYFLNNAFEEMGNSIYGYGHMQRFPLEGFVLEAQVEGDTESTIPYTCEVLYYTNPKNND